MKYSVTHSLALLVSLPCAGSFALRAPAAAAGLHPRRVAVAPAMLGFGKKAAPGPAGPSEEAQALYRMLGIAEDADYDEINQAYESLCNKYKGETKRLIKLQVAKDKILEDRLRQRMSGSLSSSVNKDDMRIADNRKAPKKPLLTVPPFLEDVMELPNKEYLIKNACVFFVMSLLPLLSRQWASTSITLGFGTGLFLLYNRGMPATGGNVEAEMRPPKAKPLVMTAALTLLFGMLGATASVVLPLRFLMQEFAISLCTCFGFFTSCTFFKVQDGY